MAVLNLVGVTDVSAEFGPSGTSPSFVYPASPLMLSAQVARRRKRFGRASPKAHWQPISRNSRFSFSSALTFLRAPAFKWFGRREREATAPVPY
jgi:hypothetical protein